MQTRRGAWASQKLTMRPPEGRERTPEGRRSQTSPVASSSAQVPGMQRIPVEHGAHAGVPGRQKGA